MKAVKLVEPVIEDEPDIEDYETTFDETEDLIKEEHFEIDDERREALKTLASQLLELREMLKPNLNREAGKQFQHKF